MSSDGEDDDIQAQLLRQLDMYMSERLGLPVEPSLPEKSTSQPDNQKVKTHKQKNSDCVLKTNKNGRSANRSLSKTKHKNERFKDSDTKPNNKTSLIKHKNLNKSQEKRIPLTQSDENDSELSDGSISEDVDGSGDEDVEESDEEVEGSGDEDVEGSDQEVEGSGDEDVEGSDQDVEGSESDEEMDVSNKNIEVSGNEEDSFDDDGDQFSDDDAEDDDEELAELFKNKKKSKSFDNKTEAAEKKKKAAERFKSIVGLTDAEEADFKAKYGVGSVEERLAAQAEQGRVRSKFAVKPRPPPEVVVFAPHQKKQREESDRNQDDKEDVDLREAKWAVRRLGTSGLKKGERQKSTVEMLVELGAKAPRKQRLTFEAVAAQRKKRQKQIKLRLKNGPTEDLDMDIIKPRLSKQKLKRRYGSKNNKVVGVRSLGLPGKEVGGVQVLSKTVMRRLQWKR